MQEIKRCARCVLPASLPSANLDETGVCAHCRTYDLLVAELEHTKAEREQRLRQILSKAKEAKKPYDCVVPLSGGKDSTYVLYLCSQVYGLKCICATLDNGYLTPSAKANIEKALQATGADHIVYHVNRDKMLALYRASIRNCGIFCIACNRGIETTMRAAAQAFDVPLVMTGHGKLPHILSDGYMPELTRGSELAFFKKVLRGDPAASCAAPLLAHGYGRSAPGRLSHRIAQFLPSGLPRRTWSVVNRAARRMLRGSGVVKTPGPQIVELYDYVDVSEEEIVAKLPSLMGWQNPSGKAEHLDCAIEEIKRYVQVLQFPELTPSTIRRCGLVRSGRMSRQEALELEQKQLTQPWQPAYLGQFLADLDMPREEFEAFARQSSPRD